MANTNTPRSHARARQLLERRQDILVHPRNALADDSAESVVPHHYYRPGELLVRNDDGQVDAFERVAHQLHLEYRRREDHGRPMLKGKGSELAGPLPPAARFHVYSDEPLEDVLRRLEDHAHGEFEATPNHVLFGLVLWGMDPYGDPRPPKRNEKISLGGDGAGVSVAIVDTGVPRGYQMNPVLAAVETWPSEEEPWEYDGPQPTLVSPQGHGSFVAGVVRQAAQNADLKSYRVLDSDGVTDEWYLGHQLALVLSGGARVINLSLGTTTRTDRKLVGLSAARGGGQGPVGRAGAHSRRRRRQPGRLPQGLPGRRRLDDQRRGRRADRDGQRRPRRRRPLAISATGSTCAPRESTSPARSRPSRTGAPQLHTKCCSSTARPYGAGRHFPPPM